MKKKAEFKEIAKTHCDICFLLKKKKYVSLLVVWKHFNVMSVQLQAYYYFKGF